MLKRLYVRALEWALAPVLGPVIDEMQRAGTEIDSLGSQISNSSMVIVEHASEIEMLVSSVTALQMGCALQAIEAAQADIEASGDAPPSAQANASQKEASILSEKFEVFDSRFQVLNDL